MNKDFNIKFVKTLPVAPLMEYLKATPKSVIAMQLGVKEGTVSGWLKPGRMIGVYTADRYAIKLGTHPMIIWGDAWFARQLD
jgi:hypothetical protein